MSLEIKRNLSLETYLGQGIYVTINNRNILTLFTLDDTDRVTNRIQIDGYIYSLLAKYVSELDSNGRN